MKKENKKYLGVSLSALAFSLSYGLTANAQTCVTPPSCETLGYTDTADKCDGDAMVKCPFDTSKVFCRTIFIPTTKTKTCDTIGDILLDDKTCAVDANAIYPDKTPIGVVFDVSRKLAIALEQGSSLIWAFSYKDIPGLTNYSSSSAAKGDYNGKSNTSIIIAHGNSNGYETPAADYCYNYSTTGTNKGDWYLPAGGELQLIYDNKATLNNSLSKAGGTQLGTSSYHWSSSEYSYSHAWKFGFSNGHWNYIYKGSIGPVRPVLAY